MARAAAIDVGTNTVLLTIAERAPNGSLEPILERARIPRLGEGVDRSRRLSEAARARTLEVIREYAALIRDAQIDQVGAVGTSALRDAEGVEPFLDEIEALLGVRPFVADGTTEAELTFVGGLSGIAASGPVVVFDVGGGSTELVVGNASERGPEIIRSVSLSLGSVRLFERFVRTDPPSRSELDKVRDAIRADLASVPAPPRGANVIGVAGTVMTLAGLARGATSLDLGVLHGVCVTRSEVSTWALRLAESTLAERLALGVVDAGRADVIPVGALLVEELLEWASAASLNASDRGVRWGLLERLFALSFGND